MEVCKVIRVAVVVPLLFWLATNTAEAKEWARKMFQTTRHDFGTVARGAKAEFDFVFQNIYQEDIHVASVRSSCGCTSPSVTRQTLKTWQKSAIHAEFNTRSFLGEKSATITMVIDKPFPAEVQLTVRGYIRSDVVFTPGFVDFGAVESGTASHRTIDGNDVEARRDVRAASGWHFPARSHPNRYAFQEARIG